MSGHSKWSKVKHQKATTDVIKAKAFTKASRAISMAIREGGGITDVNGNFKLRLAIEQARAVNMPKDNIDRAIAKAKGEGAEQIEGLLYEAYGPGGVAIIVTAASENKQRTVSAVKNVLDRNGGVLASQGAVIFQFERVGIIVIQKPVQKTDDEILTIALEIGAEDVLFFDDVIELYTKMETLAKIKEQVESAQFIVNNAEIIYKATVNLDVAESIKTSILNLVEKLEELDDIQAVYTNLV